MGIWAVFASLQITRPLLFIVLQKLKTFPLTGPVEQQGFLYSSTADDLKNRMDGFGLHLCCHTMRRASITHKAAGKLHTVLIWLGNERVSRQAEHEIEIQ